MPSRGTKAATPKSASLLFNNLAANGRSLAYVAYTSALVIPEGPVLAGSSAASGTVSIEDPDGAQMHQVRWVSMPSEELLVVASQKSLQLYTADASRLVHVVTAKEADGDSLAAYRGISSCETGHAAYVCAGVSTGAICLVPIFGPLQFGDSLLSPASQHPIVDVAAGQAPHNDPSRALVCSSDGAGDVHVHALEADGTWGHCTTFGVSTVDDTPSLCTSLRMRGTRLYCAYSTGHVRIFDLVSCSISCQITAHARWINALEVHPNGFLFATASEDTTIGLWSLSETGATPKVPLPLTNRRPLAAARLLLSLNAPLPDMAALTGCTRPPSLPLSLSPSHPCFCSFQVASVASIPVTDSLLGGVAFCGGFDKTHVASSAYDQAAIQAWRLD